MLTWNNDTKTYRAWADAMGLSVSCLHHRVKQYGVEQAMSMPSPVRAASVYTYDGKTMSAKDWAIELGYSGASSVKRRIKTAGIERALNHQVKHGEKHGMSKSPLYRIWDACWSVTTNPKHKQFADFGGRGIYVDPAWRSFTQFYKDMGDRPHKDSTLERSSNDGPYSRLNCCWASRTIQQNNVRSNRHLTYDNRTLTVSQFAREYNMKPCTLFKRLEVGMSIEAALTTPVRFRTPKTESPEKPDQDPKAGLIKI